MITVTLPRELESAGRARDITRAELTCWAVDPGSDFAADLLLCVSEAVANAVIHGTGKPVLTVTRTASDIIVTVHDGRPAMIPLQPGGDHGRGLVIIVQLAESFEIITRPDGKDFVFSMPLPLTELMAA